MADNTIANVDISAFSWLGFINQFNALNFSFGTEAVTANSLANGSLTTGNAIVNGIFAATTLSTNSLRGGNCQTNATLTITCNVAVNNSLYVAGQASTTNTLANQLVDTYAANNYRTSKYLLQITSGNSYQSTEVLVVHDGSNTFLTEYATQSTNGALGSFTANISSSTVNFMFSPVNAVNTINYFRDTIAV